MAAPGRFAAFAHKQLKRGEDIARLAKRNGRLLLPHADDGEAAFADAACKTREIAIARNYANPSTDPVYMMSMASMIMAESVAFLPWCS